MLRVTPDPRNNMHPAFSSYYTRYTKHCLLLDEPFFHGL